MTMWLYLYSVRSLSLVCAFTHTVLHEDGLAPPRRRGPSLALGEPDSTTFPRSVSCRAVAASSTTLRSTMTRRRRENVSVLTRRPSPSRAWSRRSRRSTRRGTESTQARGARGRARCACALCKSVDVMLRFAQSEQAKDEQELERATVESDEKRAEYEMALSEYSIVL